MKLEKRFITFLEEPKEIKYADFEKILNYFSFYAKMNCGGSHEIFINEKSEIQIIIPRINGKMVKQRYIKNVIKLLNIKEWFENNNGLLKDKE